MPQQHTATYGLQPVIKRGASRTVSGNRYSYANGVIGPSGPQGGHFRTKAFDTRAAHLTDDWVLRTADIDGALGPHQIAGCNAYTLGPVLSELPSGQGIDDQHALCIAFCTDSPDRFM